MSDFPGFLRRDGGKAKNGGFECATERASFWSCRDAREFEPHTQPFDEWLLIIEGECTVVTAQGERVLRSGDETVIPAGTERWGRCAAGTRGIRAIDGQAVAPRPVMLEHVALWTHRIEEMKDFYVRWFGGTANNQYTATRPSGAEFRSYFITFGGGARLEIMQQDDVPEGAAQPCVGLSHIAFGVNGESGVLNLLERMTAQGCQCLSPARRTGDGYFEAVVADPDGNRVELVAVNRTNDEHG